MLPAPYRERIRWTRAFIAVCVIAGASSALAQQASVPLPPVRPPELSMPPPAEISSAAGVTAPQPVPGDNDALRAQVLASQHVLGAALPTLVDKGGCGIAAPLRLDAVMLADGNKVILSPPVVIRASLAAAVADWVREDLAPAVPKGDRLASIEGTGGYACRSRDSIAGAKLSEHAIGDALDIHALRTRDNKLFAIVPSTDDSDDVRSFRALMKESACRRFSTVLGPGADLYHQGHLHIDLEVRRHRTHLCQWIVENAGAPAKP